MALTFNLFLLPMNFMASATNSLSIILNYLYNIDSSLCVNIIYIVLFILGIIFLTKKQIFATLGATIIYPLFVNITDDIIKLIQIDYSDTILMILISGLLLGISNGLVYKVGYNSGGFAVVTEIIHKYFKLPVSKVTSFINIALLIIGGFCFGINTVFCSIIVIYISGVVMEKIILGIGFKKQFMIITKEEDKIRDFIINQLNISVTLIKSDSRKDVIMCTISTRNYELLKRMITEIDKDAFFVVSNAYEVNGGK